MTSGCESYLHCCGSLCVYLLLVFLCTAGLYSEYGYENRLTMLENDFPGANIILHKLSKLPQARLLLCMLQLWFSADNKYAHKFTL